jgi:magnesium transporter
MITTVSYNAGELKTAGSIQDIDAGYNVWIDLTDPTPAELLRIHRSFHLDKSALEEYLNQSKKPHVRLLGRQKFAIALDMKFKDSKTILTEGVYLFIGRKWLITIHSENVDLKPRILALFEQKNKLLNESSIDALFYSVLANLIDSYEQLLTAIELTVTDFDQRILNKPSMKVLVYLDALSRQIIILRRHFWHMRDIINLLTHIDEDKEEIKYLKIIYDDINQLIQMTESYHENVNSTRELYIAGVSLQMSDAMKTLTVFSAILLPLTFISSLYGMNGVDVRNFFAPPTGFAIVIAIMAVIVSALFVYFKKKRWIFHGKEETFAISKKKEEERKKESFDDFIRRRNESSQNLRESSDISGKVATRSADKIVDSDAQ